ncbi:uncharacterized protein LOC114290269 isoform X1 [Camellia sinensis]|uniref:uncharacterized protein LOC114290269 isoform X1 n=1 Tax=Camellia sinensis TaxID=4442 RepID=UPI0010367361|nr:uncharacterized protein LOC114290269 isoform X1 [Camellia sinensis]
MATNSARRLFQRSTSSAKAFLSRKSRTQSPPVPSNLGGLAPSSISARVSRHHHSFFSTRLPVELGCGESLMPLHSATASSLLNCMLSSTVGQWGCLSVVDIDETGWNSTKLQSLLFELHVYRSKKLKIEPQKDIIFFGGLCNCMHLLISYIYIYMYSFWLAIIRRIQTR